MPTFLARLLDRGFLRGLLFMIRGRRRSMHATIRSVDSAPADLYDQVPFEVELFRQLPGAYREDYWLGRLEQPLTYAKDGRQWTVRHVILASRFKGQSIARGAGSMAVGIAYVLDEAQIALPAVDMTKCAYVAIGAAYIAS
jgi:hypothetical protein